MASDSQDKPWLFNAALTPRPEGRRHLQLQARRVPFGNLFALHMVESGLRSDMTVSGTLDADIGSDGVPQIARGTVLADQGAISFLGHADHAISIGVAEFGLDWDISRGTLRVPFKINSGSTRITLRAEFASPPQAGGNWQFAIGGGSVVFDSIPQEDEGLVLRRVLVRGSIDPVRQRIIF